MIGLNIKNKTSFWKNLGQNKKGETDVSLIETVIFIVLNIIFVVVLMIFAYNSGTRAFIYEETYAKQIALIIDNSKPTSSVLLNIDSAIEIAEKNGRAVDQIFRLDKGKNKVFVGLDSQKDYEYKYFSDYDVDLKLDLRPDGNWLSIVVQEYGEGLKIEESSDENDKE